MRFNQNKKSALVSEKIVRILLLTFSFLLIIPVIQLFQSKAEAKTAESICRGSVALREKSYTEIRDPYTGYIRAGSVATPLLCRTTDKYIPENKDATKEQIEKEIADLMAKCWETFGEGRIPDVFKQGDQFYKNCFVCYTVSLRETSKFKGEISSAELRQYIFEHPFKAYPEGDFCKITGGFCADTENSEGCRDNIDAPSSYLQIDKGNNACKKKNKKACCYTDYACWNRGGICSSENPDTTKYVFYDDEKWDCPRNMKCYIKKEDYYSYGDYIQRYGGPGNILPLTDLKPGETYAISFGSPTGRCGWCTSVGLGAGLGTAAGIIHLALLSATPPGWVVIGSVAIGGTISYIAVKSGSEWTSEQIGKFFERDINTVYLTTLNQIQSGNHCSMASDIREDSSSGSVSGGGRAGGVGT